MTSFILFSALLIQSQSKPATTDKEPVQASNLSFRLQQGQELVYRGLFMEEANSSRVQFQRSYRVECRALSLGSDDNSLEVATLTTLKQRANPTASPTVSSEPPATHVRLEILKCSNRGRWQPQANQGLMPLSGPPTMENGFMVEIPKNRLTEKDTWETSEDGRPVRTWSVAGWETLQGVRCLKLVGIQQTEDWEKPRADSNAWKRTDTVFFNPQSGIPQRFERMIETKDPAHSTPSQKSTLRCELETSLFYPGQLFEDRKKEITLAKNYRDGINPYMEDASRYAKDLSAIGKRIETQMELQTPTPYRESIFQTKKMVEMAIKGETQDRVIVPVSTKGLKVASIGTMAPDFVAQDFMKLESVRLNRLHGKPVLMVFFNPKSPLVDEVLAYTQGVQNGFGNQITVLGMSVVEDQAKVKKLMETGKYKFTVLDGSGLRTSYDLEATPKVVLLDSEGIVKLSCLGWGQETQQEIIREIRKVFQE